MQALSGSDHHISELAQTVTWKSYEYRYDIYQLRAFTHPYSPWYFTYLRLFPYHVRYSYYLYSSALTCTTGMRLKDHKHICLNILFYTLPTLLHHKLIHSVTMQRWASKPFGFHSTVNFIALLWRNLERGNSRTESEAARVRRQRVQTLITNSFSGPVSAHARGTKVG